jgi:hypothetical protein
MDVTGNLPDIPVNDVLLSGGRIYLATDLGVSRPATAGHVVALRLQPPVHRDAGYPPRSRRAHLRGDTWTGDLGDCGRRSGEQEVSGQKGEGFSRETSVAPRPDADDGYALAFGWLERRNCHVTAAASAMASR